MDNSPKNRDKEIGNRIRNARKREGITQAQLADKIGKNNNLVARWERGEVTIKASFLQDIANALNVPISELIDSELAHEDINCKGNIPSMSYWGDVLDNIRNLAHSKNLCEISLIYTLLKSGLDVLEQVKNSPISNNNNSNYQPINIRQDNVGRDATVNLGAMSTVSNK